MKGINNFRNMLDGNGHKKVIGNFSLGYMATPGIGVSQWNTGSRIKLNVAALAAVNLASGKTRVCKFEVPGGAAYYGECDFGEADKAKVLIRLQDEVITADVISNDYGLIEDIVIDVLMSVVYAFSPAEGCFGKAALAIEDAADRFEEIRTLYENMGDESSLKPASPLMEKLVLVSDIASSGLAELIDKDIVYEEKEDDIFLPGLQQMARTHTLVLSEASMEPAIAAMSKNISSGEEEETKADDIRRISDEIAGLSYEELYDRILEGKYLLDIPWADHLQKYRHPLAEFKKYEIVPPFVKIFRLLYPYYAVLVQQMKDLGIIEGGKMDLSKMTGENYPKLLREEDFPNNLLFEGQPATCKSTVAMMYAIATGTPINFINCGPNMEESKVEGDPTVINGKIMNIASAAGEMHGFGGIVLLEECNLPKEAVLHATLSQAIWAPYVLKVDGYRPIKRNPFTIYIGTMNPDEAGTTETNGAFTDRFMPVPFTAPADDLFVDMLSRKGKYKKKDCRAVYNVYKGIRNHLKEYDEDLMSLISMRKCQGALKMMSLGFNLEESCRDMFAGAIATKGMNETYENVSSLIPMLVKQR